MMAEVRSFLTFWAGCFAFGNGYLDPFKNPKSSPAEILRRVVGQDPSQNSAFMGHYLDVPVDCHLEMTRSIVGWPIEWMIETSWKSVCR